MQSIWLIVMGIVASISFIGWLGRVLFGPRAVARRRLKHGVAALVEGELVTVTGTVRSIREPLIAPLSGKQCAAYESRMRPRLGRSPLSNVLDNPVDIFERKMVPFELETRHGLVLVDGTDAELALTSTPIIPRKLDREVAFLARHERELTWRRDARLEEIAVELGGEVSVQGIVIVDMSPSADERGFRDAPSRMRIIAHAAHPLTIGPPR